MARKFYRKKTKGFTLVELLALIAIIVIMSGLLFPVFSKSRESGRRSACIGNLKNIGSALQMYYEDYNLKFPTLSSWYSLLHDNYLDNKDDVFVCPSASSFSYGANMGYGMNDGIGEQYAPEYNLTRTVFAADIETAGHELSGGAASTRHNGGSNALFGDGSIKWHKSTWFTAGNLTVKY